MSVLIKGMEMPTACRHGECNFACSAAYQTGLICVVRKQYVVPGDVPRDCPCSLDVQPVKHGRWIIDNPQYLLLHCSECQCSNSTGYKWNYCPNCGADMRGE